MNDSPANGEAMACPIDSPNYKSDIDESEKFRNRFYFDLLSFNYRLECASEAELRCLVRSFAGGKGDGIRILMALTAHSDDPEMWMRIAAAAVPEPRVENPEVKPVNH